MQYNYLLVYGTHFIDLCFSHRFLHFRKYIAFYPTGTIVLKTILQFNIRNVICQ